MRRSTRAVLLVLASAACHEPLIVLPPPVPVATISISPKTDTLVAGDSVLLTATPRDSAGAVIANATVTWTSDSLAFASVTSSGLVRTTFPGVATIIAASGDKADTAAITVLPVHLLAPSAGGHHTCALTNGNATYCWGKNLYGELGLGFVSFYEETPRVVSGTTRFTALVAGEDHTCGLDGGGAASCWGNNTTSQLGTGGDLAANPTPAPVEGGHTFRSLTAGAAHTCGLQTDSLADCWGSNDSGQLGDSLTDPGGPAPVRVAGNRHFAMLTAGGVHSCAIALAHLYCWGGNSSGELGDGTDSTRGTPVLVADTISWTDVTAGASHTCARSLSHAAYCWGKNDHGQLGTGQADSLSRRAAAVTGGKSWLLLAAGGAHTCGIAADSLAYCWGANGSGQLGDSSFTDRAAPVAVHGGIHFVWISAGGAHTCALSAGGVAYCWGDDGDGQLGDRKTTAQSIPVFVIPQ